MRRFRNTAAISIGSKSSKPFDVACLMVAALLSRSASPFNHGDDAFRAGPGTAPGERLLARRHIKPFDGDITLVIQRVEMFGHGMATGIADALRLNNPNFQRSHPFYSVILSRSAQTTIRNAHTMRASRPRSCQLRLFPSIVRGEPSLAKKDDHPKDVIREFRYQFDISMASTPPRAHSAHCAEALKPTAEYRFGFLVTQGQTQTDFNRNCAGHGLENKSRGSR